MIKPSVSDFSPAVLSPCLSSRGLDLSHLFFLGIARAFDFLPIFALFGLEHGRFAFSFTFRAWVVGASFSNCGEYYYYYHYHYYYY